MAEPLLHLDDVVVDFDGFKAIDHLTFTVMPQTVRVLIGPNGAGKSTLLDTVIGKIRPTAGRVLYLRQPYQRRAGGSLQSYPLALVARDAGSGRIVWTRAIRDTRYQGPPPVRPR